MNIVRKLNASRSPDNRRRRFGSSQDSMSGSDDPGTPAGDGDAFDKNLSLLHLRKIFTDFAKAQLSSSEYESRIYKMVPLFVKVNFILIYFQNFDVMIVFFVF